MLYVTGVSDTGWAWQTETGVIPMSKELIKAARLVVERWEKGDLAGAVRMLSAELPAAPVRKCTTGGWWQCPKCGDSRSINATTGE